jgi:hypothetical protein
MAIYRGVGGAGNATDDATIAEVSQLASQAANSATSAANSATQAASSASGASTSATNAANSASAAATSATQAASSATNAASSVALAAAEADDAEDSALAAAASASSASSSASNALSSANSAASARDAAEIYRDAAELAQDGAELAYANTLAIYGDTTDVAAAVASASSSASAASSSASAAASSASAASTSATNAANSATAALASQNAAASSASAASATASNITALFNDLDAVNTAVELSEGYKNDAGVSAVNAAASASSASTSATNAANSATQAAASAASASQIVLGVASGLPSIAPTLNLDFANTEILDPRITFTRASTATFYDGRTVAKAEENLLLRSQEFETGSWTKNNVTVTANNAVAPDGTSTADTMTASAGANPHTITSAAISCPVGFAGSVYAKAGTASIIQLFVAGTATPYANFDLTNGTAHGFGSGTTATIVNVGNGWYRCLLVSTLTAASGFQIGIVTSTSAARAETWTAAGTETVLLWGAQAENRLFVTAYTPTTTQPITNYVPVLQTAAAGVARFEHNPVTSESLGLEIEEQRANLLVRSEEFDNAAWTKSNSSIVSNTIVAPDGTLTGDKLVEDTTNSQHFVRQSPSASNVAHTFSVYLKAGERTSSRVSISDLSTGQIDVIANLSTGTLGTVSSSGSWSAASATIASVGNGWYRVTLTGTKGGGSFAAGTVLLISGTSTLSYTGDGFSGIYIWGAQLEAGAFATSYIPTVASQVTRSADAASMTGTNFSSWYRAGEGTLYAESSETKATAVSIASISDTVSAVNNALELGKASLTTTRFRVFANNTAQASLQFAGLSSGSIGKVCAAYKVDDISFTQNSATPLTDTSALIPVVTQLVIGGRQGGDAVLNGTIKKIAYYPLRLTNAQLQALTDN